MWVLKKAHSNEDIVQWLIHILWLSDERAKGPAQREMVAAIPKRNMRLTVADRAWTVALLSSPAHRTTMLSSRYQSPHHMQRLITMLMLTLIRIPMLMPMLLLMLLLVLL